MTLGVRAVVLDSENRVFLVKHSYVAGWHLPGGGVEVGETFRDALTRELMEEGRIEVLGAPALHGIFLNRHVSRRDHVAVYLVRHFRQDRLPEPNREIVGLRLLRGGRAAGGDDPGYAAADLGGARGQGPDCDLALGLAGFPGFGDKPVWRRAQGKSDGYLKIACGLLCLLVVASNVWSISRWSEARGVYDDICYLRQAHLFQHFGLGGLDTDVSRDDDRYLASKLKEIGFPTWNDPATMSLPQFRCRRRKSW